MIKLQDGADYPADAPTGTPTEPPTIPLCFDGTLVKTSDGTAVTCVPTALPETGGTPLSADVFIGGALLLAAGIVALKHALRGER